jgi:hypothetical protein
MSRRPNMIRCRDEWEAKLKDRYVMGYYTKDSNTIVMMMQLALADWQEEVAEKDKALEQLTKDHCAEDAEIRKLAKTVLSEQEVDGDTEGVPSVVDIVEMMVKENIMVKMYINKVLGGKS